MITTSSSPTHRRRFLLRCIGVLASLALLATACGADDGGAADATTTTVPPVTSSNPPGPTPEATPPGESDATPEDPGSTPGSGFTAQPLSGSAIDDLEGPVEPALVPLVEKAIADLSMRLGVPAAEISVVRAESVVWPDSSRGCPQPGMSYLMVLTDGVWIVLVHGSAAYEYRTDGAGNVTLCESTVKQRPVEGKAPGFGDS